MKPNPQILLLGGSGFYGRYLLADLLQHTTAQITVASRTPSLEPSERVRTAVCDQNDFPRLKTLTAQHDLLIHCAGPYQYQPLNALQAAIETGCHYIDIGEDRQFARRVRALAPQIQAAGITALSGISVAPAMEAVFAEFARPAFAQLLSVRTFAAPDTRKHRGPAMFTTMLMGVGRPFLQPRRGQMAQVHGWTEPEWIEFPPPIGRRLTHLVLEMADLDSLPRLFGVQTVEFKAGTEHVWLNRLLNTAARIRQHTGWPQWEQLTPIVRGMSWLAGFIGKDEGGVIFEITGIQNGALLTHRLALMANQDGGRIPIVLAGMAAEELLNGRLNQPGLLPIHTWLARERLLPGLQSRDLVLWWQSPGTQQWQPFPSQQML